MTLVPGRLTLFRTHFDLFHDTDLWVIAWLKRTIPAQWWPYTFASAQFIDPLLDELFARTDDTPEDILAWVIDAIHIHPFYDGNRRTCWYYANLWLTTYKCPPMDWDGFRPCWEADILRGLSNSDKIKHILGYYYKNSL